MLKRASSCMGPHLRCIPAVSSVMKESGCKVRRRKRGKLWARRRFIYSMEGFNFSFYLLHADIASLSFLIIRGSSNLTLQPRPATSRVVRVVVSPRLPQIGALNTSSPSDPKIRLANNCEKLCPNGPCAKRSRWSD